MVAIVDIDLYAFQAGALGLTEVVIPKQKNVLLSGTGAGKSFLGSFILARWCSEGEGEYYAVGPTRGHLKQNLWKEFRKMLSRFGFEEGEHYDYNRVDLQITMRHNAVVIYGKTADAPNTMQGTHVKGIVADEMGMYSAEAWHVIQQRCSLNKAELWVCTTPYSWNFLKKDLYDPWLESGKEHPEINVFQVPSIANPFFPLDEYEKAKKNLPLWKFNMFYRGMFTRPSGLVYSEYQITDVPLSPVVRVFAGMDYGNTNPSAIVWIAEDGRGRYQVIKTWKKTHAGISGLDEQMKQQRCRYYMDPSAGGIIDELKKLGNTVGPAKNDVFAGITSVEGLFLSGRLTILECACADLIEELGLYSYQTDGNGEPVEKIDKNNDHVCDALRYAIFSGRSDGARPRVSHDNYVLQSIRETARY